MRNWIYLAQERYYWRAPGNAALNLRVPYAMELVNAHYNIDRSRRRWEDKIRMDLKRIGINTRIWVDSTQDRD